MVQEALTPVLSTLAGFVVGLMLVMLFYLVRTREERNFLLPLAIAAFVFKAILIPLYFLLLVTSTGKGFAYGDAGGHHFKGAEMALEILNGYEHNSPGWRANDPGFYIFTAYTYILFGPNTLVVRFFLIAFTSMSLLYVYRIAMRFGGAKVARIAAVIQAFLPAPILYSLNHRKDPLIQLLTMFTFYHAVRIFRQERNWGVSLGLALLGLAIILPFRSGLVLPFVAMMLICFVMANRNVIQGISLAIVTVLSMVIFQTFLVSADSKIGLDAQTARLTGRFESSVYAAETGGLVRYLRVTGPLDIWKSPFAAAAYLVIPWPPHLTQKYLPSKLFATLHLFSLALLPHMLLGVWTLVSSKEWRTNLPLVVFPVIMLFLLGAIHLGLIRYRETFYPLCLIWAAIGWNAGTSSGMKFFAYGLLILMAIPVLLSWMGLF